MSVNKWMVKKMWYMYNGIILTHRKELDLAICGNMDGLWRYYAKWNKTEGERQIPYDFAHTCVWATREISYMDSKKSKMSEQNKIKTNT